MPDTSSPTLVRRPSTSTPLGVPVRYTVRRRRPSWSMTSLVGIVATAALVAGPQLFSGTAGVAKDEASATYACRDCAPERAGDHSRGEAAHKGTRSSTGTGAQTQSQKTAATAPSPSSTVGGGATPGGATPGSGTMPGGGAAGAGLLPYSANSFFRQALPSSTPVAGTSALQVAWAKANNPDAYLRIRGAHGVGWGIAYALAGCSDPVYRIGAGNVPASQQHLRTVGFHAPASAWNNLPPNSDAPFLIVDTCGTSARPGGLSVWGSGAAIAGTVVNVKSAGSFAHDTNGLDRRNPASDSQLNERSRGVIPDSMVIRLDVLDRAIRNGTGLGYVMETFWAETSSAAGFSSPMVGAESGKTGSGAEGQRFRIKANIDLAARPGCSPSTNPVGLAIARTLQENGSYIGDNSGSGSGIKTEQNANFPGLTADSLRGCMTWDDIEFLPPGWGA